MLGKSSDEKADGTTNKKIKWKKYYKKAEKKGIKKTSKNQMGMLDNVYNKKYKKLVDQNIRWKPTYTEKSVGRKGFGLPASNLQRGKSTGYGGSSAFLTVCIMTISDGLRKSEMQFIIKSEK
ncbi:MAG: D-alanyl-lipoteichoic acid biosynthesis protein DltD [Eubacterium ventriosum]